MNMKKYLMLCGVMLAATFIGCTDEGFENGGVPENPVQKGDEILFGASVSGDADQLNLNGKDSRTVYGDRTPTGVPVYWKEEGDSVAIFCPQASAPADKLVTYLVKPQMKDGEPTTGSASVVAQVKPGEAGLQWGDVTKEHRFYAFYPAKSVKGTEDDGRIISNIPVEQNVAEWREGTMTVTGENGIEEKIPTHFGLPNMDLAYMYAADAVIPDTMTSGSINLKFHNLLTVLDITIPGPVEGSDPITVTGINVDAISNDGQGGHQAILTGDFYCYLRPGQGHEVGYCEPVNPNPTEVSNRIAISTYNPATKKFIKVGPGEQINVKAYILPSTAEQIEKNSLRISVITMNGAPKRRTLQKASIVPGKINRVRLPHLEQSNQTNYWMSNLDPNVFFTELSLPGSHQSVATSNQTVDLFYTYEKYQTQSLEQQFRDGIRAFSFQTVYHNGRVNVFASGNEKDELYVYLKQLADVISTVNGEKVGNREFALVSLTWKSDGSSTDKNEWFRNLSDELNNDASYKSLPIYGLKAGEEITANTTIGDLAGKIVLRIDDLSSYDMPGLVSDCPSNRENSGASVGIVEYPMYWGKYFEGATDVLKFYAHDATSIDVEGNSQGQVDNLTKKLSLVEEVFSTSVSKYKNNEAHNYLFHTNIGGFYCIGRPLEIGNDSQGGKTIQYTKDIMPSVIDYVQTRGEDASLGVVLMNFADKQPGSGAEYGCDGLIQTIIYNNFSFALRKKQ